MSRADGSRPGILDPDVSSRARDHDRADPIGAARAFAALGLVSLSFVEELHGIEAAIAAQALGISRKGLYLKRQRLGL